MESLAEKILVALCSNPEMVKADLKTKELVALANRIALTFKEINHGS